ncbi:uncharacterized protein PADG_02641 [Paracoccidioides brasiliensis Pb18]|uniref:HPP transmembrane region domain-containing protein n=2 Tax=Paracoccidioides brasiliensis TaxID=121759 RepID=C1G636_PARBD|nr:uncharacterized protein PADG_02641 [Paracoccidioides brasiliensis Pb18]EEH46543.2 hypothetical protein PADG_02641 [Paracoccidioides brasiliensis Pb18]ODH44336.1 hypothetical protein ACO22_00869 [Paracoccidioides brasiliensis]
MPLFNTYSWDLDVDKFLNRYVPYPRWHLLPRPVAHFLGYRSRPPKNSGNVLVMLWSMLGVFCGLLIVAAATMNIPVFQQYGRFTIISSFGAAAVLEYCTIESPLAQPRNAMLGHVIASAIAVGISKLFAMHPNGEDLCWLSGPLACAVAVAAMVFTKTVHPPAGATALLASVDVGTRRLGWQLIPLVILSSSLVLATALLFNNIHRRFPLYWWTPEDLKPTEATEKTDMETASSDDDEHIPKESTIDGQIRKDHMIMIQRGRVTVSDGLFLSSEELQLLDHLSRRI